MASGNEILAYQGSGGLGSNSDVPAVSTKDLDIISQTADRLQAQNAYQNHQIFQQKISDRDKLMAAIDSGDVKVGDILEEDMDWVKEALSGLDDKFLNRVKAGSKYGIGSNEFIDADNEYKKSKREAQDRTTQAATRFVGDKAQAAAISTETLPHKREAMIKNNQEWKKNKWGEVKPYQQTLDADFDIIKAYPKKVTVEKTDPRNPLMKIKETTVSVPATFQEADKDFKEGGKEMYNQMELLKQHQSMQPDELLAWLTAANNRLRPHGAEIKFLVDKETGQVVIEESIPNFSAKWSMATDPQLSASTSEVDKGALDIYKAQQDTRHDKAMEGIGWYNAKTGRINANRLAKSAGVSEDIANSAKAYAEGLVAKLKSLADDKGNISKENLSKLTSDELKYLGKATTTENKFSLEPLDIAQITTIKINDDGTIQTFGASSGGGGGLMGGIKGVLSGKGNQRGESIDIKTIALNKIGDELTATTGKEMINFNNLIPLYKSETTKQGSTFTIDGSDYSREELLKGGWTEDKIDQAVKAGKIKAKK